ncbi:CBS domain-containing protein [Aquabacterium sp.]|uniref:CBS domain-containing protein n=1 Tax=Aquabacterium sp. TaxID=1872578 RepID=UPI003783A283
MNGLPSAGSSEWIMNVESICTRRIVSVDGAETLQRAALAMREQHVGAVIVTAQQPDGMHVIGIVTDRDLAIEVLARGADASTVPVARLVQEPALGIAADADVERAMLLMGTEGVRRLLVHDRDGRLVGVLSIDDLLPALIAPLTALGEVFKRGLQREAARRGTLASTVQPVLRVPALGTAGWHSGSPP